MKGDFLDCLGRSLSEMKGGGERGLLPALVELLGQRNCLGCRLRSSVGSSGEGQGSLGGAQKDVNSGISEEKRKY